MRMEDSEEGDGGQISLFLEQHFLNDKLFLKLIVWGNLSSCFSSLASLLQAENWLMTCQQHRLLTVLCNCVFWPWWIEDSACLWSFHKLSGEQCILLYRSPMRTTIAFLQQLQRGTCDWCFCDREEKRKILWEKQDAVSWLLNLEMASFL